VSRNQITISLNLPYVRKWLCNMVAGSRRFCAGEVNAASNILLACGSRRGHVNSPTGGAAVLHFIPLCIPPPAPLDCAATNHTTLRRLVVIAQIFRRG